MPKVKANKLVVNYDRQGTGEPLVLIPYLAADHACYAFQVAEYAKHFTCISLDLRGAGETDKPEGPYSTEMFADDVAAFMQAVGLPQAHVAGLSLGAATGMWLAAKYPDKVTSLSLHGGWTKTDPFLITVVEGWQVMAKALRNARITVPTQITCGRRDMLTSDRFAERIHRTIHGSELVVFEGCAHAPMYEKVEEFNQKTLAFLERHAGVAAH